MIAKFCYTISMADKDINKIQMKSRIKKKRTKPAEYKANEITRRMWQFGYKTVSDLCNHTDITQTIASKDQLIRLLMYDENILEPLFILIAEYFRFDKNEIKDMLYKRGYKSFNHLIGDHPKGTIVAREDEKALIEIYRRIAVTSPEHVAPLINFLDALCIAAQIECAEFIEDFKTSKPAGPESTST